MSKVTKRDGTVVDYNIEKIENAIAKAFVATQEVRTSLVSASVQDVAVDVEQELEKKYGTENFETSVEEIQDLVEKSLMKKGFPETAKAYILYRENHEKLRNGEKAGFDVAKYIEQFVGMNAKGEHLDKDWRTKENSTVGVTLGGLILSNSGTMTSNYWLNEIYDKDIKDAHDKCFIHIHDLGMLSGYCFTGDTKIMTPDGENPSFKELVKRGQQYVDVIAYDKNKRKFVKAKGINPRITRSVDRLVILTFRNGTVNCTTDHLFMKSNGEFVKAINLAKGDELMTAGMFNKEYIYDGKGWLSIEFPDEDEYEEKTEEELEAEIKEYNEEMNKSLLAEREENEELLRDPEKARIKELTLKEISDKMIKDGMMPVHSMMFRGVIELKGTETEEAAIEKYYLSLGMKPESGDLIVMKGRQVEKVLGFEVEFKGKGYEQDVYDLTVPEYENFALWNGVIVHNCAGWNLKQLIQEGIGGIEGKITSAPAKHLSTLCNQMVNFLGICQNEHAGAQAFSSFDTYLAPFVKIDNLSYKETKQAIQSFLYGVNTPSRWGTQAPFTNVTIDWTVPHDLADLPAIVGGKEMDFCYKDCQKEMDMINKAFIELMIEGDYNGRNFQYPIDPKLGTLEQVNLF